MKFERVALVSVPVVNGVFNLERAFPHPRDSLSDVASTAVTGWFCPLAQVGRPSQLDEENLTPEDSSTI